jgi:hypothetical protein
MEGAHPNALRGRARRFSLQGWTKGQLDKVHELPKAPNGVVPTRRRIRLAAHGIFGSLEDASVFVLRSILERPNLSRRNG